ncbi:DUF4169 family protein [Aurantimonas sp. Leaf443]|uniref:DUF4169 family protein n=1 Tax=Aurantimonas sp. Leaf443 TaxID=1736378 RepID=UPI0006FF35A5|nr:DUF4169 family protein [Aurantimonas sp. Leaf443]KQT86075.1 hypothetical protein ASG48_05700 [Aurantimonas sp. Leaf443]
MGEVVNLRQARKRARRAADEKRADENRIAHGLPKETVSSARIERERAARSLEGSRLERPTDLDRP